MRSVILAGALALLVVSPLTATAQQRIPPKPPVGPSVEGVSSAKVLAIGVGALLGAVAGQAIVAGDGITLVGGAAGGLLAAWWYEGASEGSNRVAMRQHVAMPAAGEPVAVPVLARDERVASAR